MICYQFSFLVAGESKFLKVLLSFAVGGLLGDVFLHLLPEAWEGEKSSKPIQFSIFHNYRILTVLLNIQLPLNILPYARVFGFYRAYLFSPLLRRYSLVTPMPMKRIPNQNVWKSLIVYFAKRVEKFPMVITTQKAVLDHVTLKMFPMVAFYVNVNKNKRNSQKK